MYIASNADSVFSIVLMMQSSCR